MNPKPLCFTLGAAIALLVGTMAAMSYGTDPRPVPAFSRNVEPAQPNRDARRAEPMSADDMAASLVRRGYRDVSMLNRKGAHYVVMVTGSRGERLTIVVDGLTGEISGLRRRGA